MTDIFDLEAPPVVEPASDPAPVKKRRGRRVAKAVTPGEMPAAPKRRGRPPRKALEAAQAIRDKPLPKPRGRPAGANGAARTPKFEFATVVNAMGDLKASDATLVTKIVMALNTVNAKSRSRILSAVGKMFT